MIFTPGTPHGNCLKTFLLGSLSLWPSLTPTPHGNWKSDFLFFFLQMAVITTPWETPTPHGNWGFRSEVSNSRVLDYSFLMFLYLFGRKFWLRWPCHIDLNINSGILEKIWYWIEPGISARTTIQSSSRLTHRVTFQGRLNINTITEIFRDFFGLLKYIDCMVNSCSCIYINI